MAESLIENYRQQSYDTWEKLAPVWAADQEFRSRITRAVSSWLVDKLDPKPGDVVLELAAGSGETGFMAAERVGDSGKVISTDFSPQMIESARTAGQERGLGNLEYRVMDAEHLGLDEDSVDGVICRFGFMLMADPGAALAETRRVLRPGGRLVFAVWGPPHRNEWAFQPGFLMIERGLLQPPEPGMPGIFAMGDPERIRSLVTAAGFGEPRIEELRLEWTFKDFDEYFEFIARTAGPIAMIIQGMADQDRELMRETLRERMSKFVTGSGFTAPGVALNVVAH